MDTAVSLLFVLFCFATVATALLVGLIDWTD